MRGFSLVRQSTADASPYAVRQLRSGRAPSGSGTAPVGRRRRLPGCRGGPAACAVCAASDSAAIIELSRSIITKVVTAEPFGGQCPCCLRARVLTEAGRVVPGTEFDHVFHRSLNKPEHGWLICAACHAELTHGGYLVRFARVRDFCAFQGAVFEHRRR